MKLVARLFCLGTLVLSSLPIACGGSSADTTVSNDDNNLTSTLGVGTYVVDDRPFGETYASRITFASGQKYEAEIVSGSGDTSLLAGSYEILPARANNPQSPVASDKPTLILDSDTGGAGISFELDKLPDGGLRFYGSARQFSFTMKKDPTFQPAPTNSKVIACTGNAVDSKLTLDQAQNRRGTLQITRKPTADRHDPPTIKVAVTKNEDAEDPAYVYFEGSHGDQDFYVNMKKNDFERGSGSVELNLRWAEGGQEFSVGATCAFAR